MLAEMWHEDLLCSESGGLGAFLVPDRPRTQTLLEHPCKNFEFDVDSENDKKRLKALREIVLLS